MKMNYSSIAQLVQASQDQQNNSVKHPQTVFLFVYFKLYYYFEWSTTVPVKNDARATYGKSPIDLFIILDIFIFIWIIAFL